MMKWGISSRWFILMIISREALRKDFMADEQEWMDGTDYLINQAQTISLSLAGLENGYYRINAICAARKDDGSWDDFLPMKKAPVIEVELKDGAGRISEICSEDARFQLMGQPRLDGKARTGQQGTCLLPNQKPQWCASRLLPESETAG